MEAEHRDPRITPVALFSHWAYALRTAVMAPDKEECGSAEIEHIDRRCEKGPVNTLLILACIVFGAASFIFGYDDKIISPVIALPTFVSLFNKSTRGHQHLFILGCEVPRTELGLWGIYSHSAQPEFAYFCPFSWGRAWRAAGVAFKLPLRTQMALACRLYHLRGRGAAANICAKSRSFCDWTISERDCNGHR